MHKVCSGRPWLPLLSLLLLLHTTHAQLASCPKDCKVTTSDGTVYDLSALKDKTLTTSITSSGLTSKYSVTLCGTDPQQCPQDPSNVFSGMAVQKQDAGCYVLGQCLLFFLLTHFEDEIIYS